MTLKNADILIRSGCNSTGDGKVCRSRGGDSCAFDGAMIVLQPIADTAHIVHGPIACCGNSWEGRGTLSSKGNLHRMGFTTDMGEMDVVYGAEEKLYRAILGVCERVRPKAVFVYATCVSGLIGEDIEAVCKKAGTVLGVRVIPVNAPGFAGPKNLGNRIAGEALLDSVIGTGEPAFATDHDINLIGEYNIAGDLWLVEPVFKAAGIRVLSRITGDSTFEEITCAHRAKLNVVVCSRALINIAKGMERRYGIPYVEVSFFGKTEMSKALRAIKNGLNRLNSLNRSISSKDLNSLNGLNRLVDEIIEREEERVERGIKSRYPHLRGRKAVLYTGGVKSWSFISALGDLGMEVVAIGTKKSTFEDEEKMKELMGTDAPLVEDVTPKNLLRLIREKNADILIAGGRNQYLAIKEGIPFVDVNQERHTAYAGYGGLLNLAEDISNSIGFYGRSSKQRAGGGDALPAARDLLVNPLKHSRSIGAAIAFQGIHKAVPVIHGAQGCAFLAKVLLTKHFREPIALASTKLFTENVVMGSEESLTDTVKGLLEKSRPHVIGILTSGLSEIKGDNLPEATKLLNSRYPESTVVHVPTPDYEGGLETGYAKAVEVILESIAINPKDPVSQLPAPLGADDCRVNVLAGPHLTPADFMELREIIEAFGLHPVMLPDLSSLDGSRQGFSALAEGGTGMDDIQAMGGSAFTLAIGMSMEGPVKALKDRFGIEYRVFESISGLKDADAFMEMLSVLSGRRMPERYKRQRRILIDAMRDAHFFYGGKRACIALEPDLSIQTSRWLDEMGARVELAVIPSRAASAGKICAGRRVIGDLSSTEGDFDILISNSHAGDTAKRLNIPLYQTGFPVYKVFGGNSRITIGYKGTHQLINEIANLLMS